MSSAQIGHIVCQTWGETISNNTRWGGLIYENKRKQSLRRGQVRFIIESKLVTQQKQSKKKSYCYDYRQFNIQ